ncbi:MAG: chromosome segregation protein SMC [Desulfobacterales bacterium]
MILKKLEVTGFKSFLGKTSISFPPGVSAIVGPNGCGKSNIVDALRWVMGEQSIKQLRGKSMEDIIFLGADGKAPLNMAEVSLTLNNENGSAPEELKNFTEIMVTRRFYRSGESAYFINKQPCRLKDIHNIFMGSGMGAKTYAVIQQGKIETITDAGPEVRRFFIEEAAGISRYKSRKNEALRKVEATNQNLSRILDIIAEVKKQMASLKRQARKAGIYKNLQERFSILDIFLSLCYFDGYTQQLNETGGLLQALQDDDVEHTSKLKMIDATIEKIKLQRQQKSQEISEQRTLRFEIQRNVDRIENDITHIDQDIKRIGGEIIDLYNAHKEQTEKNRAIQSEIVQVENQTADLQAEIKHVRSAIDQETSAAQEAQDRFSQFNQKIENYKTSLMDLVAREARYKNIYQTSFTNKESLKRKLNQIDKDLKIAGKKEAALIREETDAKKRIDSVSKEKSDLIRQTDSLKEQLSDRTDQLGHQVKSVQAMELEYNQAKSRYSTLKKMEENFEWYRDGVRAIMRAERATSKDQISSQPEDRNHLAANITGLMADIIIPEPSFETAVEAVLGESLQYILVDDQKSGISSIQYLKKTGAGRSGFIPMSSVISIASDPKTRPEIKKRLLNHITVSLGFEKIADALLGHVVVTDDLNEAIDIWNRNGSIQTIVTKEGDVISHQGVITGGCKEKLSGILSKKHELRSLKGKIGKLHQALESAHRVQEELESEVRKTESQLQKVIDKKNHAQQKEIEAEKVFYKTTEELKHARRHLEIIRLEQEQRLGEKNDIDDEMKDYNRTLAEIAEEITIAQGNVANFSEKIQIATSETKDINQRIVELKLKLTRLNAELENSLNNLNRLHLFHDDGIEQIDRFDREITQKKKRQTDLKEKNIEKNRSLSDRYDAIKQLEMTLEQNEDEYQTIDDCLREKDDVISGIQHQREQLLEKIRLLEIEQSQRQIKRENISDRMQERYGKSPALLRSELNRKSEGGSEEIEKFQRMSNEEMEDELGDLRKKMDKIGDVHMGAISEFEELEKRYEFLSAQREDLIAALADLDKVIKKINRITKERFMSTFHLINEKLDEVFPRLFEGGSAKLVLTHPENILDTGVEFLIHPPGKKLTRMSLLSGGEKALSAIALIFSIYLIKPTSFCLMDEIDAPLDDVNVYRFNDLIKIIGEKTQIVVITHNKKSMEFADTLFGITMEQKGISKVVSVNFDRAKA